MTDVSRRRRDLASADGFPRTAVLFFSTPGCAACRTVRSRIATLDDRGGPPVVEVAAEAHPDVAAAHGVRAAPTLIAVHDGVEVGRRTGVVSDEALGELRAAASSGGALRAGTAPAGLVLLRFLVAVLLLAVGVATSVPALAVIGGALAIWALVSSVRRANELRAR